MDNEKVKIGRFLFDSITKGLYENPLCIFREYIQNAADSLDKSMQEKALNRGEGWIKIQIDAKKRTIEIEDNGGGLNTSDAPVTLRNVGESPKFGGRNRGFRGIGRLGGMAYCTELVFTTKAHGEGKETINRWNCQKMAEMLNPHNHSHRNSSLQDVIQVCAGFETISSKRKTADSFFRVEMKGVQSSRDMLTDLNELRPYLFQVAPLPFDYQKFPFGREIDSTLRKEVLSYDTYKVYLNEEELFKPYSTTVKLQQNKIDSVSGIVPIEILDDSGKIIGRGWRAERRDLIGAIPKSEGVDGIRVRVGNILIGDGDLLDRVFRQERFNAYFVGEIHAVDPGLIPNSRRDDFEHNDIRTVFYDKLEAALGDPLSRLVQKRSSDNAKRKVVSKSKALYLQAKSTMEDGGWVSNTHREKAVKDLRSSRVELETLTNAKDIKLRDSADAEIKKIDALVSKIRSEPDDITCTLSSAYTRAEKELIGKVCNHLYAIYEKAQDPVKLCRLLINKLNTDRK